MTRNESEACVYFLLNRKLRLLKVGSTVNYNQRLKALRHKYEWAHGASFIGFAKGGTAEERIVQLAIRPYRIGYTEWFRYTPKVKRVVAEFIEFGISTELPRSIEFVVARIRKAKAEKQRGAA